MMMMNTEMLIQMLKERWAGKDMEVYFYEKSQEHLAQLKKDLETNKNKSYEKGN